MGTSVHCPTPPPPPWAKAQCSPRRLMHPVPSRPDSCPPPTCLEPSLLPHPGFLCCFGASTTVVVMALGWVLFIKILLLLLALCPASIPVVGGEGRASGTPFLWPRQPSETRGRSCSSSRAMLSMRPPPSSSPRPCSSTSSTGRGSGGRSRAGSMSTRAT